VEDLTLASEIRRSAARELKGQLHDCGNIAVREYLAWEINLVNDMASDDDQRFRVVA